jgi:hypothetical protein
MIRSLVADHQFLGDGYRRALATLVPTEAGSVQRADALVLGADRKLSQNLDNLVVIATLEADKVRAATTADGDEFFKKVGSILIVIAVIAMMLPLLSFEWALASPTP